MEFVTCFYLAILARKWILSIILYLAYLIHFLSVHPVVFLNFFLNFNFYSSEAWIQGLLLATTWACPQFFLIQIGPHIFGHTVLKLWSSYLCLQSSGITHLPLCSFYLLSLDPYHVISRYLCHLARDCFALSHFYCILYNAAGLNFPRYKSHPVNILLFLKLRASA
jgi:hypothetical protein